MKVKIVTGKDLLNFFLESGFKVENFDPLHYKVRGTIAEAEYTFVIPNAELIDSRLVKIILGKIANMF